MSYFNKTIKHKAREFILSENHTLQGLNLITQPISDKMVLANITNPYTNEVYDGLLVGGIFAEMDVLNNNNRFYSEDNYVPFVAELREQVFSTRGVYGTLEHPNDYATNSKDISHKIVDIYYNPNDKKVYGLILILNTPNGLIAQEIFKSGGALAVSARAGGAEIKQNDGTLKSELKMLITYDLVYHPGFTNAVMSSNIDTSKLKGDEFLNLNESTNFDISKQYFSVIKYKDGETKLFESQQVQNNEQQKEQQTMEENEPSNQQELESNLEDSVDKQLNETVIKQRINNIFESTKFDLQKMIQN